MEDYILELKQVTKFFGGVKAADELTYSFRRGKITAALIGPNGAGKTTLFNLISGLLSPDSGTVAFNGKPLPNKPWSIAQLGIGRLFQDVRLFRKMTVLENIMTAFQHQEGESLWRVMLAPWTEFKPEAKRKERAMQLLAKVGLVEKAESPAENLSYGQQKLVAIARLLATDAQLLLLDEPTAGINPVMIPQFLATIKQLAIEGRTIIFIEHTMGIVRDLADEVIFMAAGKMMSSGSPQEVLADPDVRAAYIGRQAA